MTAGHDVEAMPVDGMGGPWPMWSSRSLGGLGMSRAETIDVAKRCYLYVTARMKGRVLQITSDRAVALRCNRAILWDSRCASRTYGAVPDVQPCRFGDASVSRYAGRFPAC